MHHALTSSVFVLRARASDTTSDSTRQCILKPVLSSSGSSSSIVVVVVVVAVAVVAAVVAVPFSLAFIHRRSCVKMPGHLTTGHVLCRDSFDHHASFF